MFGTSFCCLSLLFGIQLVHSVVALSAFRFFFCLFAVSSIVGCVLCVFCPLFSSPFFSFNCLGMQWLRCFVSRCFVFRSDQSFGRFFIIFASSAFFAFATSRILRHH